MKKEIGLWIDHEHAVIVMLTDHTEELKKIKSGVEKHTRFKSGKHPESGTSEDGRDNKFNNHLNKYYDKVIALIQSADSIFIFGPGEAKTELSKRLEHAGLKEKILSIEPADKMTDNQIIAMVTSRMPA